jgi:hypothetical protein
MTKDEALKLALEALTNAYWPTDSDLLPAHNIKECGEAITAIKEALAQPEQEPVAFINVEQRKLEWAKYMSWDTPTVVNLPKIPLYTTPPPQRTWVGLKDKEIEEIWKIAMFTDYGIGAELSNQPFVHYAKAIEAKLKEKNGL